MVFDADIQAHAVFRQLLVDFRDRVGSLGEPSLDETSLRPVGNHRFMFVAPLADAFEVITGSARGDRLHFWNLVAREVPFSPMDRLDANGFQWARGKKPNRCACTPLKVDRWQESRRLVPVFHWHAG